MELAEKIDLAPKNGGFIILRKAGSWELGRWALEAHGWVRPDGTPVRISPTHWTPLSDDLPGADRDRLLFIARALPVPNHEAEQTEKRPITGLIVPLVTAICCLGGIVFWIGSQDPRSDLASVDVEREFARERNRAYVVMGGLTSAREREAVALTDALEGAQSSKPGELQQVRAQSETRSEAFPRKLAPAGEKEAADDGLAREREHAAQALEAKQVTNARPKESKQALEKNKIRSKTLTDELASA